jgi:hypothetical protein
MALLIIPAVHCQATPAPPIPPEPTNPGQPDTAEPPEAGPSSKSHPFEVIPGRKQPESWTKEALTATVGDLLDFQDSFRVATMRLALLNDEHLCAELFGDFDSRLGAYLSRFPGRDHHHEQNPNDDHSTRLIFRLEHLLPDEEGWDFLNEFIEIYDAHEEQAERPHLILRRGGKT